MFSQRILCCISSLAVRRRILFPCHSVCYTFCNLFHEMNESVHLCWQHQLEEEGGEVGGTVQHQ